MTTAWPEVALGDLMPSKKKSVDPRKTPEVEYDLYSIPAFDAGAPEVVVGGDVGSSKQIVESRDVLLSKIVPHIRRAWVVGDVSRHPTIGSSEWIIFRSERFDPSYLRHLLVSDRFHQAFMQTVAGVGGSLLRARPAYVAEIKVPLPPLDEQRRIAAVLDAADGLRAKRRQALAKLDSLRRSLFVEMFGGGGRPPVVAKDVESEHPRGWRWTPILEVARMGTGHTPDRNVPSYWDGDISWVNLNEIRSLDGTWCSETELKVTQAGVSNSSAVVHPRGTVCFSRTASIGFVTVMAEPMTTSQDFVTWTCGDDLDPSYLMHALLVSRDVLRYGSSGSTHKTIYVRDAERFSVLLPPMDLQRCFVERIEQANRVGDRMAGQADPLDGLFGSVQQRALRGEL